MTILGPVLSAIAEGIEPELSANANVGASASEGTDSHSGERSSHSKTVTHHFVLKKTQIIEADFHSERGSDKRKREEEGTKETKRSKFFCSCFGLFKPRAES